MSFLKKKKLLIICTALGALIGICAFVLDSSRTITRIQYLFPEAQKIELKAILQSDTSFMAKRELYIRNFLGSIGDTLQNQNLKCHELKIQSLKELDANDLEYIQSSVLSEDFISIQNVVEMGKVYAINKIYLGLISGFFIGSVLLFARNKIKPRNEAGTTAT